MTNDGEQAAPQHADAAVKQTDVLVIGGGPAGSTVSTLLARRGISVTVLEKARHPRFHIGESLLPANLPLFEQLGVAQEVRAIGMQKWGAEFIDPVEGRRQDFRFKDAWDKSMPYAYQVRRSSFDEILLRNAQRSGAEVIEECRVREVDFDADAVQVQAEYADGRRQQWRARFVVDASGRDTFLANKFDLKRRNPKHNSAAIFAHFGGAERHPGELEGHISIYWFDHGWFWFIPLQDGATSIGAVVWPYYLKSRTVPVEEFFLKAIESCAPLAARLRHAKLISPVEATGNYSYNATRTHGERYLLLGDAFMFIDPVFSSGVMLAMQNAFMGASAIEKALREPRAARAAWRAFDRELRYGPREFSWFIYRVTSPTMRDLFMAPRNILRMKEALLSLLAGDIFGRTPIWRSLWYFKVLYAIASLLTPQRSRMAARRRSLNIRPA